MKTYKTILTLFFFLFALAGHACEICGCGVGNFYLGLLPNFDKRFIGIRYQYLDYKTVIKDDNTQFSKDKYQTIELWGGWNLGEKWRLMTFVPYHVNSQVTDDGNKSNSGIGDITLLANYSLLHHYHLKANKKTTEQQLWIGGGIKLATGKYNVDLQSPDANIGDVNSQMGTGTTDFLINSSYNVRFGKWGVNTTANYKINTTNKDHYYFGNRFIVNSLAFYSLPVKHIVISPNAGLLFEHAAGNYLHDAKIDQTGGHALFALAGIELSVKKMAAGINAQLPLTQNFAEHQTNSRLRGMAHISLAF